MKQSRTQTKAVPRQASACSKKPNNTDLPEGVDQKLWRRTFIPTYMRFVGSQSNPWEIPVKVACSTMQLIWDPLFTDIPYDITGDSLVYLLVRTSFSYEYRY